MVNLLFNIFIRLVAIFGFFTWHRHVRLSRDEVDYTPYLGTNEEIPISDSLGNLMKEFYSQVKEHSSRLLRQQSGKDFVRMGSQLLPKEDLDDAISRRSEILDDG